MGWEYQERWDDQSEEYKQKLSEDKKKWWEDQSEEYRQKWSEDNKQWTRDLQQLSSWSTEEATYYAIDGENEDGMHILITEIFGTNDLNFTKRVRRTNKIKAQMFHTMENINELHLQKCSTQTCTKKKKGS